MLRLIMCKWLYLLLFLILLAGGVNVPAQGTWEAMPVPSHQFLRSVCFLDSLNGWISGDSGTILHTSDGGISWEIQKSNTVGDIMEIFFLDRNRGWASAFNYQTTPYGTTLLKTRNGGVDWEASTYAEENIFITCIYYRDTLHGWMGGKPHKLVYTEDGGTTWVQSTVDTSILAFFPVLNLEFYNDRFGWACGGLFDIAGVIWRTADGGKKWYAIDPGDAPADEVHALHAFDSLRVMGAGGDPDFGYGVGIIRTNNGGVSWNYEELGMAGFAVDLDFRTGQEAWAPLGNRMQFIFSRDAGVTWETVETPGKEAIFNVHFPDSLHGFAVGANGSVLKYLPPPVPGMNDADYVNSLFSLIRCYPNPFTDEIYARFRVSDAGSVSGNDKLRLTLYDHFGRLIFSHQVPDNTQGECELLLQPGNLQAGSYFCFLELAVQNTFYRSNPIRLVKIPQ